MPCVRRFWAKVILALAARGSARHGRACAPLRDLSGRPRRGCADAAASPSSQPGRNTTSNSRPLALCSVIRLTRSVPSSAFRVHHQADMLQEAGKRVELLHEADQLFQILELRLRLRRLARPATWRCSRTHRGSARQARYGAWSRSAERQRSNAAIMSARDLRDFGFSSSVSTISRAACISGTLCARASWCSDFRLDSPRPRRGVLMMRSNFEIVRRVEGHVEIGGRVPDLLALVEARAADHAIGKAERDEAILEGAHLEAARTRMAISLKFCPCAEAARYPRR